MREKKEKKEKTKGGGEKMGDRSQLHMNMWKDRWRAREATEFYFFFFFPFRSHALATGAEAVPLRHCRLCQHDQGMRGFFCHAIPDAWHHLKSLRTGRQSARPSSHFPWATTATGKRRTCLASTSRPRMCPGWELTIPSPTVSCRDSQK
jgi:hypothetical protein